MSALGSSVPEDLPGRQMRYVGWACIFMSWLGVLLRFYCRKFLVKRLFADDYLLLACAVGSHMQSLDILSVVHLTPR